MSCWLHSDSGASAGPSWKLAPIRTNLFSRNPSCPKSESTCRTSSATRHRWQTNAFRSCGRLRKSSCRLPCQPTHAATGTTCLCWAPPWPEGRIAWSPATRISWTCESLADARFRPRANSGSIWARLVLSDPSISGAGWSAPTNICFPSAARVSIEGVDFAGAIKSPDLGEGRGGALGWAFCRPACGCIYIRIVEYVWAAGENPAGFR